MFEKQFKPKIYNGMFKVQNMVDYNEFYISIVFYMGQIVA